MRAPFHRPPSGECLRPLRSLPHGQQKSPASMPGFLVLNSGNFLLSHTLARAVPSGLRGLTSVFGMGTGVAPSLLSPKIFSLVACGS